MSHRLTALSAWLGLLASGFAWEDVSAQPASPTLSTLEDVSKAITPRIRQSFSDVVATRGDGMLTLQAKTMQFTVHRVDRIGQISSETYQRVGPRHDGFILMVKHSSGRYRGPAVVPQTVRYPYWNTLINEIYDAHSDTHLWINYSFGSRVPRELHNFLLQTLGSPSGVRSR